MTNGYTLIKNMLNLCLTQPPFMRLLIKLFTLVAIVLSYSCSDNNAPRSARKPSPHLVETISAKQQSLSVTQTLSGTLQAIRSIRIINQVPGLLTSLPVYPGDKVQQGQLLVQIDDGILKAEVEKAQATVDQTKVDYRRLKDLAPRKLASESEVAQAKTTHAIAQSDLRLKQTELHHSRILAPIAGIISQRLAEPGDVIPLHSHLLTLIDTSSLKAEIKLSELLLPLINKGNPVDITIDALGKQTFKGKIKRIFPVINNETRRGTIEVILNPVPEGALAGQFCRVKVYTQKQSRLMLNNNAVRHDKQGAFVYVLKESKAQRVNIITGIQQNELIEVLDGLDETQQIISKGFLGLKDGMPVKLIATTESK